MYWSKTDGRIENPRRGESFDGLMDELKACRANDADWKNART